MIWYTMARILDGKRAGSSSWRSIAKAWGLATSWIRCRPRKICVWPLGSSRTVWASQTFSSRLRRGVGMGRAHSPGGCGSASFILPAMLIHGMNNPGLGRESRDALLRLV